MNTERSPIGLSLLVICIAALFTVGCGSETAASGGQAGVVTRSQEASVATEATATATIVPATPTLASPPVTILLDTPPPGTQVGSPLLITGRTSALPPDGALGYRVRDSANAQIGSGSFPVTPDSAMGGGAFSAELTFTEPATGGAINLLVFQIGPGGNAYGQVGLALTVAPQTIWIDSPPPGTLVGSPVVITGRTAHLPQTGNLAYRVAAADGKPLGSGVIPLSPAAGSGGSFNASLEFSLPSTGDSIQIELLDLNSATGVVHARAGLSLAVSGQAAGGQGVSPLVPLTPSALPTLGRATVAPAPTATTVAPAPMATTAAPAPTATTVAPAPAAATLTPTRVPSATPTLQRPSLTPVPPSPTYTSVPFIVTFTPSNTPTATPCLGLRCPGIGILIDIPPGSPDFSYIPCKLGPTDTPRISVWTEALSANNTTTRRDPYVGERLYYFPCNFSNPATLRAELSGPNGTQELSVIPPESPLIEDVKTEYVRDIGTAQGVVTWNAVCDLPTGAYTLTLRSGLAEASLNLTLKPARIRHILSVPQAGPAGTTFTFYYCGYGDLAGQDVGIDLHYLDHKDVNGKPWYQKSRDWIVHINGDGWATSSLASVPGDPPGPYMLRDQEKRAMDKIRLVP